MESSPGCLKTSIYLQPGLSKLIPQQGTGTWLVFSVLLIFTYNYELQLPVIHNFIFHPNPVKSCHLKILLENSKQIHIIKGIPGDTAIISQPLKGKIQGFLADPTYSEGYNNACFATCAINLLPPSPP